MKFICPPETQLQQIKKELKPTPKSWWWSKRAYGSDATAIGRFLKSADYLEVAYVREGISLRNAGIQILFGSSNS